jgi:hypothetical protein
VAAGPAGADNDVGAGIRLSAATEDQNKIKSRHIERTIAPPGTARLPAAAVATASARRPSARVSAR